MPDVMRTHRESRGREWLRMARRAAMVPLLVITAAPAFDGHAVTLVPRWAHAGADVVHMVATSIWIGVVVGLVVVMP